MSSPAVRRALSEGNATVIGIGQGRTSARDALPLQLRMAKSVHEHLTGPHRTLRAYDKDGERSVIIVPRLQSNGMAAALGESFNQRSVLNGKQEVATEHYRKAPRDTVITEFGEVRVSRSKPKGFWTFIPEEELFYSLVPVTPHMRGGRPVVGYASRRKVRRERAQVRTMRRAMGE